MLLRRDSESMVSALQWDASEPLCSNAQLNPRSANMCLQREHAKYEDRRFEQHEFKGMIQLIHVLADGSDSVIIFNENTPVCPLEGVRLRISMLEHLRFKRIEMVKSQSYMTIAVLG